MYPPGAGRATQRHPSAAARASASGASAASATTGTPAARTGAPAARVEVEAAHQHDAVARGVEAPFPAASRAWCSRSSVMPKPTAGRGRPKRAPSSS